MIRKIGEYEFSTDELLGAGSFATVYRGRHVQSGRTVAIKAVDLLRVSQNLHDDRYLESEIKIMLSLRHPNIVLLEDAIRVRSTPLSLFRATSKNSLQHEHPLCPFPSEHSRIQ